jgi:predicted HTH domain antitoxin
VRWDKDDLIEQRSDLYASCHQFTLLVFFGYFREIEGRLKLSTALLMFQAGQLSLGAACEFAGVDRYTFMAACKRYHIAVINYDEDELETDFEQLKRTYLQSI